VKDWPIRFPRFSFKDIPSLGEGELAFTSPLTVISGANGVGKTTLLRAIWAAADSSAAAVTPVTAHKLPSGTAVLSFVADKTEDVSAISFQAGVIHGGNPLPVDVIHLDVSSADPGKQNEFCTVSNLGELLNGVGSRTLDDKQLAKLGFLARRTYSSAEVYEIELGDEVVPYFEIAFGDDRYDSRTMGTGELAIFYLWVTTHPPATA
jgi:hypothetical protein